MTATQLRRIAIVLALASSATVAGCSSSNTDNNNGGGDLPCAITITGALTASPECTNQSALWTSDENATAFSVESSGGATTLSAVLSIAGQLKTGTFTGTGAATGTVSVQNGTALWTTNSYSLALTSVSAISSSSPIVYTAHGTLTATVAPAAGSTASGNVTLTATF